MHLPHEGDCVMLSQQAIKLALVTMKWLYGKGPHSMSYLPPEDAVITQKRALPQAQILPDFLHSHTHNASSSARQQASEFPPWNGRCEHRLTSLLTTEASC